MVSLLNELSIFFENQLQLTLWQEMVMSQMKVDFCHVYFFLQ